MYVGICRYMRWLFCDSKINIRCKGDHWNFFENCVFAKIHFYDVYNESLHSQCQFDKLSNFCDGIVSANQNKQSSSHFALIASRNQKLRQNICLVATQNPSNINSIQAFQAEWPFVRYLKFSNLGLIYYIPGLTTKVK